MQQEAARRVQRMQERSRRVLEQYQPRPPEPTRTPPPLPNNRPRMHTFYSPPARPMPASSCSAGTGSGLLSLGTDQWLLLGLALLLLRSGGHTELVLALLYLAF